MPDILLDVSRLTVWLVLLIAIFLPLEKLFPAQPAKFWRAQFAVDLAWYFINSIVPAIIISLPIAALVCGLNGLDPWHLYSSISQWPLGIKLCAAFLVNDIGAYWVHRWAHRNRWLWRFHALHHSAAQMDWLVNTRAHPVDMVLIRLGGLLPVYLLGLSSPTAVGADPVSVLVMISGTFWSFFIHANLRWRLGPLEWLIATPAFHHWHHTNDQHRDHNFAAIFPWLDRLFGSHYLPSTLPPRYGIDASMPATLIKQLFAPLYGWRSK